MSTSVSVDSSRNKVVLLWAWLVLSTVLFLSMSFTLLVSASRYKREFQFDEVFFIDALNTVVTNYLSSLSPTGYLSEASAYVSTNQPSFLDNIDEVSVSSYASWSDCFGNMYCQIDGNRYRVGDISRYGVCQTISDDRAYFVNGSRVTIVRLDYTLLPPPSPDLSAPLQRRRQDGEDWGDGTI